MKATTILITIIIIVAIILGVFSYFYIAKPSFDRYVLNKQMEAKDVTLTVILQELNQKGYVQIQDIQNNSIILVPYQSPPKDI